MDKLTLQNDLEQAQQVFRDAFNAYGEAYAAACDAERALAVANGRKKSTHDHMADCMRKIMAIEKALEAHQNQTQT